MVSLPQFFGVQHGARRGYAVPTGLEKAGMLDCFYTELAGNVGLSPFSVPLPTDDCQLPTFSPPSPLLSLTKRIFFGAAASWFSRGVTILLGLVLLPVLFRTLPKEELGVWLLLGQSWAAMGILDLGFGITFTRRIALAKGRSGADPNAPMSDESLTEIANLVACGRRVYRIMAGAIFLTSWLLGFSYLGSLELHQVSQHAVWLAWTILCASQALNVWATIWTSLLQGVGYVGWDAIIGTVVNVTTLGAQIVAVLCGGGLVALAAVAASGALLQRSLTRWLAKRNRPELFSLSGQWDTSVFRSLLPTAMLAWLTSLGYVLVANSDPIFIAQSSGTANIPAFRAALLLVMNMHFLSGVFAGASLVFVSHLWQDNKLDEIRAILRRNTLIGLLTMSCGSAVILVLGATLFDLWLGPGNFVGHAVLGLFLANYFLEHQANVFSSCGRATNDEAYAIPSLLGGVLKLGIATVAIKPWGLVGLAASTLVAQMATIYWYSVYRASIRLGLNWSEHVRRVLVPCLCAFGATYLIGLTVDSRLLGQPLAVRVAAASLIGGSLLMVAFWLLVLRPDQRQRWFGKLPLMRKFG